MSDLTLEKMKINERLTTVEIKINNIEEKVSSIHRAILGNNGSGLVVKVDRLEQLEKNKRIHYSAIWASLSGLLIVRIWDFITGNK